jgi:D-alanyl-D-alanine dipeptidase
MRPRTKLLLPTELDRREQALSVEDAVSAEQRWAVPIEECGEPLVPLATLGGLLEVRTIVPARARYLRGRQLWARCTVVDMLAEVARSVAPGYRLVVFDAYRSIEYQAFRFKQLRAQIAERRPGLSDHELDAAADKLIATPDTDPKRPPPHATGGAIDMMLEGANGRSLDYGSAPSNFATEENARHPTNSQTVTPEQRAERVRLVTAAVDAGFASYPGEWWHFMYGDQEYALCEGRPAAIYGRADLVPGDHEG